MVHQRGKFRKYRGGVGLKRRQSEMGGLSRKWEDLEGQMEPAPVREGMTIENRLRTLITKKKRGEKR